MCDGLGRKFSYTCPNTTLFQQRMLICDHWYMVNCSKAESDYGANLLIGKRLCCFFCVLQSVMFTLNEPLIGCKSFFIQLFDWAKYIF